MLIATLCKLFKTNSDAHQKRTDKRVMVMEPCLVRQGTNSQRGRISAPFHAKPAGHRGAQTARCDVCETLGQARVWRQKASLRLPGRRVMGMFRFLVVAAVTGPCGSVRIQHSLHPTRASATVCSGGHSKTCADIQGA